MNTLTVKEVAAILNYNEEYLRRKIKRGEIPAFKVGKKWLIKESDLKKMMEG